MLIVARRSDLGYDTQVDNTTSGVGDPTFGRNSIKLVSNASYSLGTLYVVDAVHLPYGCSVWPAIWTLSSETLDDEGGEIGKYRLLYT